MIFCDTSTAAKLYVPESQSTAVRKVLEAEDAVCVSELFRVELMAVFHRRLRETKWSRADFTAALRQFSHDDVAGFWTWLPLDGAILAAAANTFTTMPTTVFLRGADSLHLVTALHHKFSDVHTHDMHQIAAASVLGLKTVAIAG
jgi:predicted nucleic acid-binding protein